jgi:hypothetical protein
MWGTRKCLNSQLPHVILPFATRLANASMSSTRCDEYCLPWHCFSNHEYEGGFKSRACLPYLLDRSVMDQHIATVSPFPMESIITGHCMMQPFRANNPSVPHKSSILTPDIREFSKVVWSEVNLCLEAVRDKLSVDGNSQETIGKFVMVIMKRVKASTVVALIVVLHRRTTAQSISQRQHRSRKVLVGPDETIRPQRRHHSPCQHSFALIFY